MVPKSALLVFAAALMTTAISRGAAVAARTILVEEGTVVVALETPPAITTQPAGQTVVAGQTAIFGVVASGMASLNYHWQSSTDGVLWVDLLPAAPYSGVSTTTLTVTAAASLDGTQYRCVVTNSLGSVTSNSAMLGVISAPTLFLGSMLFRPGDLVVNAGQDATFLVAQSFSRFGWPGAATFQWQFSSDQGFSWQNPPLGPLYTWINLPQGPLFRLNPFRFNSAIGELLTIANVPTALNGLQVRVVATNAAGSTTSAVSMLVVRPVPPKRFLTDGDGDGKNEIAVFRPSIGGWFIRKSSEGYSTATAPFYQWGLPGDVPLAAHFDGDGKLELSVFRPTSGQWFIRYSSQEYDAVIAGVYQWGLPGDVPIPGDFDGDGRSEIAVFRPSIGGWFIRNSLQDYSTATASFFQWGLPGDVPIAADFDGDGKSELTVFRPSTGQWFIRYSSLNYDVGDPTVYQWGLPGDVPLAADFDGDGRNDLVIFRPSIGGWFIRYSSQDFSTAIPAFYQWGLPGDVPIVADFDGDGKTELTVFRPATGEWFIRYSGQDYSIGSSGRYQWGLPGDVPIKP